MQELAHHVYIETSYAGRHTRGDQLVARVDLDRCPFPPEDARSWRSALVNLGGGVDRLLVNLDAHFDRTLGVRAMDCTVVGHEKMAEIFRNRPITFKTQGQRQGPNGNCITAWEASAGCRPRSPLQSSS